MPPPKQSPADVVPTQQWTRKSTMKVGKAYRQRAGSPSLVAVPLIRLSGKWLAEAGFHAGQSIEVETLHGEIRIVSRSSAVKP